MSRLDYHTILDPNVNVDVDAEFDNPTILNHNEQQQHDHQDIEGEDERIDMDIEIEIEQGYRLDAQQHVEDILRAEQDGGGLQQEHGEHETGEGNGNIMDDEQDDTPFVIMEEDLNSNEQNNGNNIDVQDIPNEPNNNNNTEIPLLSELEHASSTSPMHQLPYELIPGTDPRSTSPYITPFGQPSKYRPAYVSSNRPISLKGMTEEEKKYRQKEQNRKAAERSRTKKRSDQIAVEQEVERIQKENQELRSRLSALLASKASNSPVASVSSPNNTAIPISDSLMNNNQEISIPPIPTTTNESAPTTNEVNPSLKSDSVKALLNTTGIDYKYIKKLTNELNNSKTILMGKKLRLRDMKLGALHHVGNEIQTGKDSVGSPEPVQGQDAGVGTEEGQGPRKEHGDAQVEQPGQEKEQVQEGESGQTQNISSEIDPVKERLTASRKSLLQNHSKLTSIKAEESSLTFLLKHLKNEIEILNKQNEIVKRKLYNKRNNIIEDDEKVDNGGDISRESVGDGQEQGGNDCSHGQDQNNDIDQDVNMNSNVQDGMNKDEVELIHEPEEEENTSIIPENNPIIIDEQNQHQTQEEINQDKALDDIRGWIDAAVKDWDQNLPLPQSSNP